MFVFLLKLVRTGAILRDQWLNTIITRSLGVERSASQDDIRKAYPQTRAKVSPRYQSGK